MTPSRVRWVAQRLNPRSASLRYRCIYPMSELSRRGHDVGIWQADEPLDESYTLVFDAWTLFPTVSPREQADRIVRLAHEAKQAGARIVLDNCDNQHAGQHRPHGWDEALTRLESLARIADVMVTCSSALGEEMARHISLQAPVRVIDDPIEERIVFPGDTWWKTLLSPARKRADWRLASHALRIWRDRRAGRTPLVWFGSHGNPFSPGGMLDLLAKREVLEHANRVCPVSLTIVSNQRSKFEANFKAWRFPTHYLEWDRATFHRAVRLHDISLIPSEDNAFTRCKSSNRVVLSAHLGLDVLADPVPSYLAYAHVARIGSWSENLDWLLKHPRIRLNEMARRKADLVAMNGIEVISNRWEEVLFGELDLPSHRAAPTAAAHPIT